MRIRRYAARLLASSAPANASAPPRPDDAGGAAAPWLHAAADDCDICQLTRGSDPQVAPDGIKHKGHTHIAAPEPEPELLKSDDLAHRPPSPEELFAAQLCEMCHEHSPKEDAVELEVTGGAAARPEPQVASDTIKHEGHIASPEPEGELESDERVDLPRRPHASEELIPAQACDVDYEYSTSKDVAGLEVTGGTAVRLECTYETTIVSEVATEPAAKGRAFVVDEATDEQEVAGASPLVNGSVIIPEVTGGVSPASGPAAELQVLRGTSLADEVVAEREVSEGVSIASGSTAEPQVLRGTSLADEVVAEREVSEGVSIVSGLIAEPQVISRASLADEAVAEREVSEGVSTATEAATEPADAVTAPGVTTGAPLDDEGVAEPDIKMGASPVDESTAEMDESVSEAASYPGTLERDSLANENAMEREVSGGVSPASEAATYLETPERASLDNENTMEQEVSGGVSPASEAATEPADVVTALEVTTGAPLNDKGLADTNVRMGSSSLNEFSTASEAAPKPADAVTAPVVTTGAPLDDQAVAEPDIKMGASPADVSTAEMDESVSEAATHPGIPERASLANENAMEREVSGGVSLASESATEPADVAEMDVTELGSVGIEAATHSGLPERFSLANENASEREMSEAVSPTSQAATEPADVFTEKVTTGAPLEDKGVTDWDIKMEASSVNESAAEMDFVGLGSLVIEAATHPGLPERVSLPNENATEQEVSEGFLLVKETSVESADVVTMSGVTTGAPPDNEGIAEPDIKMGTSLVNESSAEIDAIQLGSLVEAATDPGLPENVSLANKTATEREGSEGASLVIEAAAEPADVITGLEVTTGAPHDKTKMGASLVIDSTAEMDRGLLGSVVIEAATHPGLAERVSLVSEVVTETGVTGTANLDAEVSVEPEAIAGPSLLDESTGLEITGSVSVAKEAAAEPEVTCEASACSEDGGTALMDTQPLDCDMDYATVQLENAGVSIAKEVQSSRDDAADEVVSISSASTGPVRDKSPAADEVRPHDDTPSVSCVSGIVARSVGKSGRTDIICYARRSGKRKLDMADMETEQIEMDDGDICDQCEEKATLDRTAPCESAMSTAGSAEIKLADIKRGLADNSASSKCKRRKGRYECDIDYCRMTFKKKTELSVHKKNMCTVKSCGKRFRCHKYLKRHQSIHNEDTPYKCPWEDCSMAFKWTWSLADHFQVHTGEKPYRCKTPGCSKIYKYVSDFIRHKKRCKPQR